MKEKRKEFTQKMYADGVIEGAAVRLVRRSDLYRDHVNKWRRYGTPERVLEMIFRSMTDEQLARDNNLRVFRKGTFF